MPNAKRRVGCLRHGLLVAACAGPLAALWATPAQPAETAQAAQTAPTAETAPPAAVPAPALASPTTPDVAPVVQVRQYVVLGATLLPPSTVEAALAGLTGPRTVEELHRAAADVQALYSRVGYGAVVVYLPPQEVSGGVITLQVIEGRLSAVRVEGAGSPADEAAVLASLPALKTGQTPRIDQLDLQLRLANANPARRLRLVLLPGQQPEQTEAEVAVQPGARRQVSLDLDNTGPPGTGRARLALGWRDADFSARDDVLDLRLQLSPDQPRRFAAASLNYRLPLYDHATLLDAYALVSDTQSSRIPTAAGDLRFAGRGDLLGARATRYLPRLEVFEQRLAVGLERRAQRNQCAIGTLPGDACGSAGGDLVITPLSVEYSVAGDAELPLALSATLVQGLSTGGRHGGRAAFEAVRPGARPDFTLLRLEGNLLSPLGPQGWEAGARLAAQWAAQALVPAMQFGAGGRDSVRGYEERELAADHGIALSLELSAPRQPIAPWPGAVWRALVFADAAQLRNRAAAPCSGALVDCVLASAGVGLRLDAGALHLQVDLAHTLHAAGTTERSQTRALLWLHAVH